MGYDVEGSVRDASSGQGISEVMPHAGKLRSSYSSHWRRLIFLLGTISMGVLPAQTLSPEEKEQEAARLERIIDEIFGPEKFWEESSLHQRELYLPGLKRGITAGLSSRLTDAQNSRFVANIKVLWTHVRSSERDEHPTPDDHLKYWAALLEWGVAEYLKNPEKADLGDDVIASIDRLHDGIAQEWSDFFDPMTAEDKQIIADSLQGYRNQLNSFAYGFIFWSRMRRPISAEEMKKVLEIARDLKSWKNDIQADFTRLSGKPLQNYQLVMLARAQLIRRGRDVLPDDRPQSVKDLDPTRRPSNAKEETVYSLGPESRNREEIRFWLWQLVLPGISYLGEAELSSQQGALQR
ncbi:MAG: hypothetical protein HYU36_22295 [Planctomycetes bacterium]|nr:hypothetical protein [Planctomycetota bacterium]